MSAERIANALRGAALDLGAGNVQVRLGRPRDPSHGDLASNVALALASRLRRSPREVARELADRLGSIEGVDRVEVAGPGFLNFHLGAAALGAGLDRILIQDDRYGRSDEGKGRPIMVEFVSANPTGPLHLGHGRQAALGDAISNLLDWSGWDVHREFYFNDAGGQVDRLTASVHARCRQLRGRDWVLPPGGYAGEYITEIARALLGRWEGEFEDDRNDDPPEAVRRFAIDVLRREQREDLEQFGVYFDEFYPETRLYADGRIQATIRALDQTGLTYEKDDAIWLRTSAFGDQKDRVMVKRNGSPTYFLPDVAYHMSKWERGFRHVINVQGADHHSTVDRVRAGLRALGRPSGYPEYVLHQMVTVERDGAEVRFSKRAGSYTTLADLVGEVGRDVARYFFLMRRPEAHLTVDLDVALDRSDKNPVYKVQYAHARLCSVFVRAGKTRAVAGEADLSLLVHPAERELAKQLAEFPGMLRRSTGGRAPHIVCDYLERTAGLVNSWYHAGNPSRDPKLAVLVDDDRMRAARLALADAARIVLRNGLLVLGVSAPERMDRTSPGHEGPLGTVGDGIAGQVHEDPVAGAATSS